MKQILGSLTNDSFGRGEASSERKITWFQIYSLPVDKGLKQVKQLVQQQNILALHTHKHTPALRVVKVREKYVRVYTKFKRLAEWINGESVRK